MWRKDFLIVVLLLLTASVSAGTWFIDADGTGDYPTIQSAIDASEDGDIIVLSDGTYRGDGNRDVLVEKTIVIRSTSPSDPNVVANTIIDCAGSNVESHRAFSIYDDIEISGLTIKNGLSDSGGGIYCESLLSGNTRIAVTIKNCKFKDNRANGNGGAIYSWIVNLTIQNSIFEGSSGNNYGGAIYCYDSSPTILGCNFLKNKADNGGCIATWSRGTITIKDTFFDNNTGHGSAIDNNHCKLYIDKSIFVNNTGKVITSNSIYSRFCTITNSIFAGNSACCIESSDRDLKIGHCTFKNNPALIFDEGNLECTNSIFIDAPISVEWTAAGSIRYCCFSERNMVSSLSSSIGQTNNIVQDPLLDDNFIPFINSPCLDAGSNADTTKTADYYGNPRVWNRTTDMGAVELEHDQATIGINPTSFSVASDEGGSSLITKTLHIFNSGASGSVGWDVFEDCPWLVVEPTSGLSDIDGDDIILRIDPAGLSRGKYHYDLILVSGDIEKVVGIDLSVNGTIILTPGEDVQAAIDIANDGDVVLLTAGRYSVNDLTFSGKKITLQGEDVYSTILEPECFMEYCPDIFYFRNGETHDSKIVGLTITGSYSGIGSFHSSSPSFERCIFRGYTSDFHHMIYGNKASLLFDGCVFAENRVDGYLMEYRFGHIEIRNCTFINNVCDYAVLARASTVTVSNSILWNETSDHEICLTDMWGEGAILNISYSDVKYGYSGIEAVNGSSVNWGNGNIHWKPMVNDTYHLMLSSRCINAGNPGFVSDEEDIDGHPRVSNGRLDMGADEYYLMEVPYEYPTIQEAIDEAEDGAEIIIYPGVYGGGLEISSKDIILRSYDPHDLELVLATVIECDSLSGVSLDSGSLQGFLITNSFQAISCSGFADVKNCVIQGNTGSTGTAIYAEDVSLIRGCYIIGNEGDSIIELGDGSPILDHCTIAGNSGNTIVRKGFGKDSYFSEFGSITNSILWNPGNVEIEGRIFLDYCCVDSDYYQLPSANESLLESENAVLLGDGNVFDDPMLDDYYLTGYSPCIDAGDPNYFEEWLDFEADPLHAGRTDIGADQYQYFPRSPDFVSDGVVDLSDLAEFISQWLKPGMSEFDLDYNKQANLKDFSMFADWWLDFYPKIPTAWEQGQVPGPAFPEGIAFDYGGVYFVEGSGSLYNLSTYFMYKEIAGDFEITARLRYMTGNQYACAGLMMLDDNYHYALIGASQYAYDISMYYFRGYDGLNFRTSGYLPRGSGWLRITKSDGMISIYDSEDGINWNVVQKIEYSSSETVRAGIFVNSGDHETLASGLFSDVTIRQLD